MMITEDDLNKLESFGRESNGDYSDRRDFSIIKSKRNPGKWIFCHFCEVDGSLYTIKTLKDMDDLRNVYNAITDEDLV